MVLTPFSDLVRTWRKRVMRASRIRLCPLFSATVMLIVPQIRISLQVMHITWNNSSKPQVRGAPLHSFGAERNVRVDVHSQFGCALDYILAADSALQPPFLHLLSH